MKVDFTKAKVEVVFSRYEGMDTAKVVGDAIHQNTSDIGIDETARNIYHSERELETPDEQTNATIYAFPNVGVILVSTKKAILNLLELTQG